LLIENAELFAVAEADALTALEEARDELLPVLVALVALPALEEAEVVCAAALLEKLEREISGPKYIRNRSKINNYNK